MKRQLILFSCLFFFFTSVFAANKPLLAAEAFQFSAKQKGNVVEASWSLAPGYYLYKDKFKFEINTQDAQIGAVSFPEGTEKEDPYIGKHTVYFNHLNLTLPISSSRVGEAKLKVTYQGCASQGFCYPPMTKEVSVTLKNTPPTDTPSSQKLKGLFQTENVFILLLAFFGFGILLSFTPCVLPMIPILSSIILGEGKVKPLRGFYLSTVYVLGMSVAFAIAGMLASLAGDHLQAYMQCPLILSLFAALFVILALSLFGLFDLRMPHFLHHRVMHLSSKQKSGTLIGAFVMGFLSILIVSPCVSAPLVAALGLISQKGDLVLGTFALWLMGVGMGVPLLVIGTFGPRLLPKTGKWMHAVKAAFGVVMLGLAIMLLSRFLPGFIILVLWAGLFIITAVNMGIFSTPPHSGVGRVWNGLGYIFFIYGIILLVGAAHGNTNPLMPLKKDNQAFSEHSDLSFHVIKNKSELETVLSRSKGQFVMVDFSADWCTSCRQMDQMTFSSDDVRTKLKNVVLVKVDVTSNSDESKEIEAQYNVIAPPTILFFNREGSWMPDKTLVGETDATKLVSQIDSLTSL